MNEIAWLAHEDDPSRELTEKLIKLYHEHGEYDFICASRNAFSYILGAENTKSIGYRTNKTYVNYLGYVISNLNVAFKALE